MSEEQDPQNHPQEEESPEANDTQQTPPSEEPKGQPAQHEQIRESVSEPTEEDLRRQAKEFYNTLFMLMQDPRQVHEAFSNTKRESMPGSSEENDRYIGAVRSAQSNHPHHLYSHITPFDRDDSLWRQGVSHNGEELMAVTPRVGAKGTRLSGESAVLRVRAAAELGTIVNVPLWHTGIWVKIKAPSEATLLELERRLTSEKVQLGRATMGAAFANTSVYINGHLLEMIFNHVHDSTYPDINPRSLKSVIRTPDIPILVWGMACAIWPNGYRLTRPCVHNPEECNHIDEAHVNLSKLCWVDHRSLTTVQRNHMSERDADTNDERVKAYQQEHLAPQYRWVSLNESMSAKLEVPSIAEYEKAGYRWIDAIVRNADEAFGQELRGQERNDYLYGQAAMTNLRRYAHWVSEIRFQEGDTIEDRESLDEALDALSGQHEIREKLINSIEQFMKECVICAIGLPSYTCPKCGGGPDPRDMAHNLPEILQLEINEIFFILMYIRVTEIMNSD